MSNEVMRREMKEAMDAGERALSSLRSAQEKLNSAGNWGIFDMLKDKRMKNKLKVIGILSVFSLLLVVWIIWGNTALVFHEQTIKNSRIPSGFSGFRIAQISDLHNAEFGEENEKLLSMLEACEPDMILITGDLVDSRKTDIETGIVFSRKAAMIAPTYYVTGNHEARIEEYEDLIVGLEKAGVRILQNESVILERSGEMIAVAGIEDPSFVTDYLFGDSETFTKDALSGIVREEDTYTVLLAHRPELFDTYVECKADLVFSGHAHGGQFRLPFIGGFVAPNQGLFPKYDSGLYSKDGTDMMVSRGLGNSILPFRINNRPEIVLVELQSEEY